MDLTSAGEPVVGYGDGSMGGGLSVQRWNGSAWVPVGTLGFTPSSANQVALALNDLDLPTVAYADAALSDRVTVQRWDGSTWQGIGTAGISASVATGLCMGLAPTGHPVVSYLDNGFGNKAMAQRWNGSAWVPYSDVPISLGTVFYQDLAVGPDGNPAVVYMDQGNNNRTTGEALERQFPVSARRPRACANERLLPWHRHRPQWRNDDRVSPSSIREPRASAALERDGVGVRGHTESLRGEC
ncbi:MAG: hypothetical protein IPM46_01260 [Flavobacteriales bacterium]|nr:hypothetical protein [Flavobacteriales bacterium]